MQVEKVSFGVFSDLHLDVMHDGKKRFDAFMEAMSREKVDFIIQLGDFCYPENTDYCACSEANMPVNLKRSLHAVIDVPKMELLHRFNSFEKPSYHVLGNHEFDFCTKERALDLYGMKNRYYSFLQKGWRFLVLDGNNYRDQTGIIRAYRYGDYFDSNDLPYIDEEQMEWIERILSEERKPTVIFSHQPVVGGRRSLKNGNELLNLIDRTNKKEKTVYLCMNGHIHVDELTCRDGVYFYTLNSMSNYWLGEEYECKRYDAEIEQKFPNLRYVLPYEKPLFAVVTLDCREMVVKGQAGAFVKPGSQVREAGEMLSPSIADRKIVWQES